jgi:phage terminase large subunit GpA-like protein
MATDAGLRAVGLDVLRVSDTGDVVEWCQDNILSIPDSPMPGPYRSERTPWVAEALRIWADPETRLVTVLASIQSGKTLLARLATCHIAGRAPGPTLVLQDTDQNARDFNLTSLRPLWDNCPPVKSKLVPEFERSSTIQFQDMTCWVLGAWNEKNLQRRAIRYLIGDEIWLWPKEALAEASARVTAFGWMGKRLFMSQGGTEGDAWDVLHRSTDQRDWHMSCPSCGHLQPWLWEFVRFPEEAKSTSGWDKAKVAAGTTYECARCSARLPDTAGTRAKANDPGRGATFIATAPANKAGHVGLHWNSLASMSWGELGVMMLEAKEASDTYGDESPRRIFKQKRLALPWAEEGGSMLTDIKASDYRLGDGWDGEAYVAAVNGRPKLHDGKPDSDPAAIPLRTMGVDVQQKGGLHFWAVVRSWSARGESRLRWFGRLETWQDVEALAVSHGVHRAMVMVDSGDQTQMVYSECAKRDWKVAKGSGQPDFSVGPGKRRFYSEPQMVMLPGQRARARLISFSNLAIKDIVFGLRSRRLHTFPVDIGEDYVAQMDAEVRVKDRRTGKPMWILPQGKMDNHALDCECLAALVAIRWGVVGRDKASEVQPEGQPEEGRT